MSTARLSEKIRVSAATGAWFPMAGMKSVTAIAASAVASSPLSSVTVQLQKATDNAGTNAASLGSSKTSNYGVAVTALAEELGYQDGAAQAVPYTHVRAVVTDTASPDTANKALVFEPKDVTPSGVSYVQRG